MKHFYIKARKNEIEQTMQELLAHIDKENMRVIDVVFIRDFDFCEEMIVIADEGVRIEGWRKGELPPDLFPKEEEDMSEKWAELLRKGPSDE